MALNTSATAYSWKDDPTYQTYLGGLPQDQRKRAKKKSRRSGVATYLGGADPYQAPAGQQTQGMASPRGQGTQGMTAPATGQTATAPGQLGSVIADDALRAPAGSLAGQFSGVIKNPEALETVAANPIMQADELLAGQYGLPGGSRSAAMLATYLDPMAKAEALGIYPENSVDWINFGEQLMTSSALQGNGVQLNPKTMVQTLVQTLMREFEANKAGGPGSTAEGYSPLRALAEQNPVAAISAFTNIVQGALQGTMPAEQLSGYVSWLKSEAQRFLGTWAKGDQAGMESSGQNWLSTLVQKMGPSLGL